MCACKRERKRNNKKMSGGQNALPCVPKLPKKNQFVWCVSLKPFRRLGARMKLDFTLWVCLIGCQIASVHDTVNVQKKEHTFLLKICP